MRLASLTVLLFMIPLPQVFAQQPQEFPSTSGNAFARICSVINKEAQEQTPLDVENLAGCVGYFEGVVQGVSEEVDYAHAMTNKKPPAPYCLPEESENGQLIKVVLKFIGNHPEEAHKSTAYLITLALRDAFPCHDKRR